MSSKKYVVLNTLLSIVVILFVFENYRTWNHPAGFLPDTGIAPSPSLSRGEGRDGVAAARVLATVDSYKMISENNIFNPERKDFPTAQPSLEIPKANLRPQVILYGVAIAADYQSATVSNFEKSLRKEERESRTMKVGQKIGEYKLAKILPDRIALEGNGDSFEVLLHDSKKPNKIEAKTETKPAMVASPQPAPLLPLGEAPTSTPPPESVKEPNLPGQAQALSSLPFNKYTYQQALSSYPGSVAVRRGRIFYKAPAAPPQEAAGK